MDSVSSSSTNSTVIEFLESVHKMVMDECVSNGASRDCKVTEYKAPEELEKILQLDIGPDPLENAELMEAGKRVVKYSVKTGHPRFFNQLYGGCNLYGLGGAWVTEALNTNCHTFEVAPAFIVIEKYMIQKMCDTVGFEDGDGIFVPGGAFSNIMAAHLARYKQNNAVKKTGMFGQKRLILFASDQAHYSITTTAAFLGFGSDSVVKVATDARGRMLPSALEGKITEAKEQGNVPLFVMATSGTTVMGAFDPLNELADICREHCIWLHVDACWGGAVLFSKKRRHLMIGVNRADSVSWNAHKMIGAPLQTSLFVLRHKDLLDECNSTKVAYLYQTDKLYDSAHDRGNMTVQCGKKVDSFKLWLMWKALGDNGMENIVEKAFFNAKYITERLNETEGFRLTQPEFEFVNICFWYIPPRLRGQNETKEWWHEIAKVAPKIKARMITEGSMMIGYQPNESKGLVNFFRIIMRNPDCDSSDMDFVINEIQRLGKDL